jgi:hypothetical protein
MFTTLKRFTVILLAILQLVAPLVHAHAGDKVSDLGLHVPGLEIYGADYDFPIAQEVSYDFSSEGILVGIDTGIKDKQVNAPVDVDNSHYLHQQAPVFNVAISRYDINFSPQQHDVARNPLIPSLSPRAPPAQ